MENRLSANVWPVRQGCLLYPLDLVQYQKNGDKVSAEEFQKEHQDIIDLDAWVIDGLGTLPTFWSRVDAADTVIYIDMPYRQHYWWATKRLLLGFLRHPEGWPEGSSVWKGTLASWRALRLSPRFWNDDLLAKIRERATGKRLIHVKTVRELRQLLAGLE